MKAGLARISCLALVLLATAWEAHASAIAFDTAGDSAYNGISNYNGVGGGYGWGGPWQVLQRPFIGSSSNNDQGGPGTTGEINSPDTPLGRAWGIHPTFFSSQAEVQPAYRPFNGTLAPGQIFAINFDSGILLGGDPVAVALRSGPPPGYDNYATDAFYVLANAQRDYLFTYSGPAGLTSTGIPMTDRGIHIEYEVLDDTHARLSITSLAPGGASGSWLIPYRPVDGMEVYNFNETQDVFFNNIAITPEPGACALLVMIVGSLILRPARPYRTRREPRWT